MLNRVKLNKTHQFLSPVRGRLLIAEPFAQDLYFSRSVVMLLDSHEGGFMGLVLNKPLKKSLNHLFAKFGFEDMPIYRGGPVDEDRLFFLHNIPDVNGAVRLADDLFVGGDLNEISECFKMESRSYKIRFFMGYSGWSSGQLESEIKDESWVVSKPSVDVFSVEGELAWQDSLLALNDDYYTMWLNFPFDPTSN